MDKIMTVGVHEKIGVHDVVDAEVIKIRTMGPEGVEREFEYPTTATTLDIVNGSTGTTTTTLPPEQIMQITETVDYAKSVKPYVSKFKIGVSFKDGFTFELERLPSQVTKTTKKG